MLRQILKIVTLLPGLCLFGPGAQADLNPRDDPFALYFLPSGKVPPQPLAAALSAAAREDWPRARSLAERAGPAASVMITARMLLAGAGTLEELNDFLRLYPGWPGQETMRAMAEVRLSEARADSVLRFFDATPPRTGTGALAYARAARELGQDGEADIALMLAWRTLDLTQAEHDAFLRDNAALLAPHHDARLDMVLWRGLDDVQMMLPLASDGARRRAEARLAIKLGTDDPSDILAALPPDDRQDPGIAHEVFNAHIRADRADEALDLILRQSRIPGGLGQPDRWAGWRVFFARKHMQNADPLTAYDLAALNQMSAGAAFADLEWIAGYVALHYLDDPAVALRHFRALRDAVQTPISLGRAWYWIGRAHEAAGDTRAAQAAYAEGAAYQSSFYGLLAAERAGIGFDLDPEAALHAAQAADPGAARRVGDNMMYQAALLMRTEGGPARSLPLLYALADTLPETDLPWLERQVESWESPFVLVRFGKRLAQRGIILPRSYYPLHPMSAVPLAAPTELSLAIARRESEFNPGARSGAGAEGLMQLMPGTAHDMARAIGVTYEPGKVIGDWVYNALLGSSYLADLAERFDGNVVMIAAGYNAGPGRPIRWMDTWGDPRQPDGPDIVDWIEHIPFNETRNYVMRVSESLPIYREWLGKAPLPQPFSAELSGSSIRPVTPRDAVPGAGEDGQQ